MTDIERVARFQLVLAVAYATTALAGVLFEIPNGEVGLFVVSANIFLVGSMITKAIKKGKDIG